MASFESYVFDFYGPDGIYGDFFDNNLTKSEVRLAVALRFTDPHLKFAGCNFEADTLDREVTRDIMLWARGTKNTEYKVERWLKNTIDIGGQSVK